jgi:hypothetical protein
VKCFHTFDPSNENNDTMNNTYTVTLVFEGLSSANPLEAVKAIQSWVADGSEGMIYDVLDEKSGDRFSVDLNEDDEDAVVKLPKVDPTQTIYVTNLYDMGKRKWAELLDDNCDPFTTMSDAIAYVREHRDTFPYGTGLSTYRQMLYDNAEWDNL